MDDFEGRTAVITGAASGIGLALAEKAAGLGMNVVLADIEEAALEDAVQRIASGPLANHQARAIGVPVNTMLAESVAELAERALTEFGRVHFLANNAGVAATASAGRPIWEVPDADWDWVMGVNFQGVLYGVRAFVPHMLEHGEPAHIVNTASLAALLPGGGTYGVSKHAVLAFSEGLARDLAERNANVSVSVLCPGFVNTRIHESERNRPESATVTTADPEAVSQGQALMAELLRQGMDPTEIAEHVFAAVRSGDFYVLPHPAWDDLVRSRIEQVLARGRVATTGIESLAALRDTGRQL